MVAAGYERETVTVYGASDDLIEIEGALSEEFCVNTYDATEGNLAVLLGEIEVDVHYNAKGEWKLGPIKIPERLQNEIKVVRHLEADEDKHGTRRKENESWPGYSDILTLEGPVGVFGPLGLLQRPRRIA